MDINSLQALWMQMTQDVSLNAPSVGGWVALGVALLLLLCSGFVSASEIAFFSLTPSDLSDVDEEKHWADHYIKVLREESERLLATILISNNFINVTLILLLNFFVLKGAKGGAVLDFGGVEWLEFLVITVLLTFLLLLFGEVMPKIYSAHHTLSFCRLVAPTIHVLHKVLRPISSLLMSSKRITSRLVPTEEQSLTVDDLEQALELTDKQEIAEESQMLQGIIRFGGETVREVMTSRMDVVDLDIDTPFPEVLKCIVENNYSRIPVYQGMQDNIKGVLYIKDLLPHLRKPASFRWQTLIRPPYFVPETKKIDDLLRDFQKSKVHIAIVVDEFGGTSGIVTMEDIIEEIVGEINDEYDDDERPYTRLNQNTYVYEGKTLLADFTRHMDLDDDFFREVEGESDTLAGLLLEIKGEFPQLHERIDFGHLTFEVMQMDRRRILSVKVVVH